MAKKYKKGDRVAVCGKLEFNYGFKRITNASIYDVCADQNVITSYSLPKKISNNLMKNCVLAALDYISGSLNVLPDDIIEKYKLLSLDEAYRYVHFPHSLSEATAGRRTIKFYELLLFQLKNLQDNRLDLSQANDYLKSFSLIDFIFRDSDVETNMRKTIIFNSDS